MRKFAIWAFVAVMSCSTSNFRDSGVAIESVKSFDSSQYLGQWYEIARFPNWFEKDCVGVTAQYSMRDDGQIDVLNTCRKSTLDGEVNLAKGIARVESIGKLSVTFTPWLPFARGDYWVLGLRDYDIAVVGNPKGSTGWILARKPEISQQERLWANHILRQAGYDTNALIDVVQ